ncbi:MAG TPA: phosphoglucosamine mutase [Firmicutes bacterium]|nr:phosphoglucosamine mutase [Bacillota bacterium]
MGRLFGTDGVRDVANAGLSPELAFKLGRAGAALLLRKGFERPRMVLGRDTRISGDMLEAALVAGMTSCGAEVLKVGVIPTPGVAFLTRELKAQAGVVISASHNPVEYNGIKFFSSDGFKLLDEDEELIERLVLDGQSYDDIPRPTGGQIGTVRTIADAGDLYARYIMRTVEIDLTGYKIVIDCAHGAAYRVAPRVLSELGATVIPINVEPNGVNINVDCGSTHPERAAEAVREHGADVGLAHDGDADRLIAIDENGRVVNGDHIMAICGLERLRNGSLPKRTIVATVYSNLGLVRAFEREGGQVVMARAGDRYVLEEMLRRGVVLGGEQSGHVIFLDYNTTGDGLITALQLLSVMKRTGKRLSELAAVMEIYPQVLVNVRVRNKSGLESNSRIVEAIRAAEERLSREGRIFVRCSGTEPLVRILGEGPEASIVESVVNDVARVIEEELS